jgi:hypothetical protein
MSGNSEMRGLDRETASPSESSGCTAASSNAEPLRRTIVLVDATAFAYNPDDLVDRGATLGRLAGQNVVAPFSGRIESISFDGDAHALRVVLRELR